MSFTEVDGIRGMLVQMGLGTSSSRAFTVGGIVGVSMYALGLPKESFTDEGEMRSLKALSPHPSATNVHFLVVPVGAAVAAYLFT